MNGVFAKVVAVMFVLALLTSVLGISASNDFFVVVGDTVGLVSDITDKAIVVTEWLFSESVFDEDDRIVIERVYFEDGHYADLGYRFTIKGGFAKRVFLYCSNPEVRRMSSTAFYGPIYLPKNATYTFYDVNGKELYKSPFTLGFSFSWVYLPFKITYGEYLESYQKDPSKDAWRYVSPLMNPLSPYF